VAGHGTVDSKGSYILTYDSDPQDLSTTAIPMQEIQDLVQQELSKVGRVVLLADVCRAAAIGATKPSNVNAAVERIGPLTGMVISAGVFEGCYLEEMTPEFWDRTMAINVRGPMNLVRAVLPQMRARGNGRIVLTGSMSARNAGSTLAVEPAYAASKGALHTLVRYFARQVAAEGVIVNGVSPGPILTPLLVSAKQPFDLESYPMKRFGQPEEIGWPAAFLASRGASFTTGAVLDVNGGMCFS